MLFQNGITEIKSNGYVSNYFQITRSATRFPIAPFLYISQAELMVCDFRGDY